MIKAISIRQPWADLIVSGLKDIENRTWNTTHRGKLLIHASQTFDREAWRWVKDRFPDINLTLLDTADDHRGAIIGEVDLVDCMHPGLRVPSSSPWWQEGQYGLLLKNPKPIGPYPYSGKLSIFNVDERKLGYDPTR